MFSDEKTVLKIWLNVGLNLTIFRGTGPRSTKYCFYLEEKFQVKFFSNPQLIYLTEFWLHLVVFNCNYLKL